MPEPQPAARVWPSAVCPGCGQERTLTTGGTFRRHRKDRRSMADCPGAGQRPADTPTPAAQPRPTPGRGAPPLPDEPAAGRSCDGGHCNRPSIGWRLYRDQPDWLPVCGIHMDGPPGRTRIYDPEEN